MLSMLVGEVPPSGSCSHQWLITTTTTGVQSFRRLIAVDGEPRWNCVPSVLPSGHRHTGAGAESGETRDFEHGQIYFEGSDQCSARARDSRGWCELDCRGSVECRRVAPVVESDFIRTVVASLRVEERVGVSG